MCIPWGRTRTLPQGCPVVVVQCLCVTPLTAASLSFTISQEFAQSCPLSWWYHPAISSSVVPFSSCLQSFPASESFPMSQLFVSGGQSIGASASVLPVSIQGWFPLGLTGLISLESKGLSRIFFSITVWKHQFFGTILFLNFPHSHLELSDFYIFAYLLDTNPVF